MIQVWSGRQDDLEGIYNHLLGNPAIHQLRVPGSYYAWGDAYKITGNPSYSEEVVLAQRFYRKTYAANHWGYRFHRDLHPEIQPTVFR